MIERNEKIMLGFFDPKFTYYINGNGRPKKFFD